MYLYNCDIHQLRVNCIWTTATCTNYALTVFVQLRHAPTTREVYWFDCDVYQLRVNCFCTAATCTIYALLYWNHWNMYQLRINCFCTAATWCINCAVTVFFHCKIYHLCVNFILTNATSTNYALTVLKRLRRVPTTRQLYWNHWNKYQLRINCFCTVATCTNCAWTVFFHCKIY